MVAVMSKIKRLDDIDDDLHKNEEELNPFSFKEFIRSKEQQTTSTETTDKTYHSTKEFLQKSSVSADLPELPTKGIHEDERGHFVIDNTSQADTKFENTEEEWEGTYQPLAIEEAHEFGLRRTFDRTPYSDGYPFTIFGNDEADTEIFMPDVPLQTSKSSSDHGNGKYLKLKEENAELRNRIKELVKKSETDDQRIRHLTDELQNKRDQDEREAKALESMIHSVEQNLQLMTKRAVKAENTVAKLKQEIHQLQDQLEGSRGELATMNIMKRNAHMASEYLTKATRDAETSIKQLLEGAETLSLVSQMLSSIDKVAENLTET